MVLRFASQALSCVLFLMAAGASTRADITMEEHIGVQGSGAMSMANMSGKTVTAISGNRARTESDLQLQSRLMRMFAHDGPTAEIVRLEEDKVYEMQLKKKRYTESSLHERRAQMQKVMEQQRKSQAKQQQTGSGVDESQ